VESTLSRLTGALGVLLAALVLASCGGSLTPPVPPTDLTYSENPATYPVGIPIAPNTPSARGGPVEFYSVVPPLPQGLSLGTTSGVITGTPAAAWARASYTVIATNPGGSTGTAVSIGTDPRQVTVTVMQPGGPVVGVSVIESSGIDEGTSPPEPTGVIETLGTDIAGRATFTVPSSTSTGKVCFSSPPTSGNSFRFASSCTSLTALEPTVLLVHF
jgi:hypothetical protein